MMFLEKFWRGDITPGEKRYRPNREYSKGFQTMERCEVQLKDHLSEEDWTIFKDFTDAALEISALENCDNFIDGFRMGVLFMIDALNEPSH